MPKQQRNIKTHLQILVRSVDIILRRVPQGMPLDDLYNVIVSYPDAALRGACIELGIKLSCRYCGKERLRYHLRNYKLPSGVRPIIYVTPLGVKNGGAKGDTGRWVNAERMAAFASSGNLSIDQVIKDLERTENTLRQQGAGTLATAEAIGSFVLRLQSKEIFLQPALLGEGPDQLPDLFAS